MLGRKNDLEQLAIIRPTENGVTNARRLYPARTFPHDMNAVALELVLEPAFEDIDQLEFDVVMVALTQLLSERRHHADYVSGRQSAGRGRNAEISIR